MNRRCQLPMWRRVLLVLAAHALVGQASNSGLAATARTTASGVPTALEVCQSRTINYITHTLPQQCLRTSWAGPGGSTAGGGQETDGTAATVTQTPGATQQDEPTRSENATEQKIDQGDKEASSASVEGDSEPEDQELATSSFMSFEEWKEMMLRKSGQDPDNIKGQKQREHRERDPSLAQADLDSIGDDGEISFDFDALSDKVSEMAASSSGEPAGRSGGKEVREEQVMYIDGTYRSKDAGKTCKERFSFSSFDAGATVLKTSPGAKSANSILVENKDSYMLLECRTKNKFVIVELSDDILVDTIVLANYEFFSSMIRKFRVSVSARYPVKLDKWVDLGTYEARNSRDIQAFLITHPQIYTKYIRIEFLTHYGTEYYCPVSLLRVHGTRMLDTWKESDTGPDDEVEETIDAPLREEVREVTAVAPSSTTQPAPATAGPDSDQAQYVGEMGLSPWRPLFDPAVSLETCMISSPTTTSPTPIYSDNSIYYNISISPSPAVGPVDLNKPTTSTGASQTPSASSGSAAQQAQSSSDSSTAASSNLPASPNAGDGTVGNNHINTPPKPPSASANATDSNPPSSNRVSHASSTASRNKTSSVSSAAAASPTVQESFFKAVTKRLQHLESNTSLSLQYIEDQSRFLQDALQKMEKRQISRVDSFLDTLNKTVLSELRNVRTQYDQIWQSTVLALETQREQNEREIVALSSRLNILADEVVFQKRMAILQSVLLLSCLVLVIFSRGFVPAPLDIGLNPQGSVSAPALVSPGSPRGFFSRSRVDESPPHMRPGVATRMSSSRHPLSRSLSYNDKVLPLTPTSEFSREGTPIIQVEDIEVPFFEEAETSYAAMTPPPSSNAEDDRLHELNGMENTRDRSETRTNGAEQAEEPTKPMLRHSHSTMSQISGGSVRKPLPALPEDPSREEGSCLVGYQDEGDDES